MIEFVSYNGKYPNLCSGELVLRIDGKEVSLDSPLWSGGYVTFDDDWREHIGCGEWSVNVPEEFAQYANEITEVVNDNVPWGCCGGCV